MNPESQPPHQSRDRTSWVLASLSVVFLGLAGLMAKDIWGHVPPRAVFSPVDPKFLETTPWRRTYADLVKAKEDLSDYDCYGCHEKSKPPPIRYNANNQIVVPKEHANIVMKHGAHDRNNLCYNCHNEQNLVTLQAREGRVVKFDDIPALCGTCHSPAHRDWEAGVHGRTSGHWNQALGEASRLSCASCHNPHDPKIPTREPAPAPHSLGAAEGKAAH